MPVHMLKQDPSVHFACHLLAFTDQSDKTKQQSHNHAQKELGHLCHIQPEDDLVEPSTLL